MAVPLARREIRYRTGRALLLVITITVAVAFTTGAFGFAEQVSLQINDPTMAVSSLPLGTVLVSTNTTGTTATTAIDSSVLDEVRATSGVLTANGLLDQPVSFALRADEQPERPVQLRGLVLSSDYDQSRWRLIDGRAPVSPDEVAVDPGGAIIGHAPLGSKPVLELPTGSRRVTVVGLVTPVDSEAGRTPGVPRSPDTGRSVAQIALSSAHVVLPPAHAAQMLGAVGKLDRISVVPSPGTSPEVLSGRLRSELSSGLDVIVVTDRSQGTQQTVAKLDSGVRSALFAFAGLTILVSALAVSNIYAVLIAARTRELALLRLIGARRAQIGAVVLREAAAVGILGAIIGLAGGSVLARIAIAVVKPLGVQPSLHLSSLMAIAAGVVGIGVALAGAAVPALRASRSVPLDAISDTGSGADRPAGGRTAALPMGAGIALAVAASTIGGLSGLAWRSVAILGVILMMVGLALGSRWIVKPLCNAATKPLAIVFGLAARLGVGNVRRAPSRAAAAASTLMVTLALVAAVATVGSGIKARVNVEFSTTSRADLFVERRGLVRVDTGSLFSQFGRRLAPVRDGAVITSVDGVLVGPSGTESQVTTSSLGRLGEMIDLDVLEGQTGNTRGDGDAKRRNSQSDTAMLSERSASQLGVKVGDHVTLRSTSGREASLSVVAVYRNTAFVGPAVVAWPAVEETGSEGTFELAALDVSPRSSVERTGRQLRSVADTFPRVRVHTTEEFAALNSSVVDLVLRIIGVLLAGTVGIGLLGLASTLALSVHERRREIVMLRAVGARRSQIRAIIGIESAVVAAMAALVGLVFGAAVGWTASRLGPTDLLAAAPPPIGFLFGVGATAVVLGWLVGVAVATRSASAPPSTAGAAD